jgi:hypothetical protein
MKRINEIWRQKHCDGCDLFHLRTTEDFRFRSEQARRFGDDRDPELKLFNTPRTKLPTPFLALKFV